MANKELSGLTAASTQTGADLLLLEQSSNSRKQTLTALFGGITVPVVVSYAGLAGQFVNTTDNANVQVASFEGDRATPADNDRAYFSMKLSNDGGTQTEFARQSWRADDVNAGTSEDGSIFWAVNVAGTLTDKLRLAGSALVPSSTDGLALGSLLLMWSDLFIAPDGVINFNAGDVTITHSANLLTVAGGNLSATLVDPAIVGAILEDVFTITDGAAFEVDPGNGSLQIIVLGANRTPLATNFAAGESVTLLVDDGTARTLTWTDTTWGASGVTWVSGTAPTLATTGYTVIEFWKVGTQVYGALVGSVA